MPVPGAWPELAWLRGRVGCRGEGLVSDAVETTSSTWARVMARPARAASPRRFQRDARLPDGLGLARKLEGGIAGMDGDAQGFADDLEVAFGRADDGVALVAGREAEGDFHRRLEKR